MPRRIQLHNLTHIQNPRSASLRSARGQWGRDVTPLIPLRLSSTLSFYSELARLSPNHLLKILLPNVTSLLRDLYSDLPSDLQSLQSLQTNNRQAAYKSTNNLKPVSFDTSRIRSPALTPAYQRVLGAVPSSKCATQLHVLQWFTEQSSVSLGPSHSRTSAHTSQIRLCFWQATFLPRHTANASAISFYRLCF